MKDRPFACLTILLGLLRLLELGRSKRNERRLGLSAPAGPAAVAFRLMVGLHIALFTLPLIEPRRARPRRLLTATVLAVATGLRWWCIRSLAEQWNVRGSVPVRMRVVDGGPYRWVRHPNYLAVVLEFAALPLFGGAWRSALVLSAGNGLVLWRRIAAEEAMLDQSPEYRQKMAGKPRFIPGLL